MDNILTGVISSFVLVTGALFIYLRDDNTIGGNNFIIKNKLPDIDSVGNTIVSSFATRDDVLKWANHWNNIGSFKTNIDTNLVLAMVKVESDFRNNAVKVEGHVRNKLSLYGGGFDKSLGLMQTLTSTAVDMYNKGYKSIPLPTIVSLQETPVSIYYGMAYIDWLQARMKRNNGIINKSLLIQYYNGGYGNTNTQTKNHLRKVLNELKKD